MKLSLRPREGGGRHTACQLLYGTGGLGRGTEQIKKGMNEFLSVGCAPFLALYVYPLSFTPLHYVTEV